jgi:aspartyl-tRNA(Asn)/glutamyl-tRNA(Gln) amidotransferase subunit B
MNKITQLEKDILVARKSGNAVAKNLLMTLKGEYQNSIKNGQADTDETLEKLIRKYVKNAELVGTLEAQEEIQILNSYLPKQLSEDELRGIITKVMLNNPTQTEAYHLGNKGSIGFLMGCITKETAGRAEPKVINQILISELNK